MEISPPAPPPLGAFYINPFHHKCVLIIYKFVSVGDEVWNTRKSVVEQSKTVPMDDQLSHSLSEVMFSWSFRSNPRFILDIVSAALPEKKPDYGPGLSYKYSIKNE